MLAGKTFRTFRLNPSYILVFLIVAAMFAAFLERAAQDRRSSVVEARENYLASLTATRTQLAGLLEKIATDKSLAHNLSQNLQHSIKSTLEAQLQAGALDQLTLLNAACEPIAKSSKGRFVPVDCSDQSKMSTQFFWVINDGVPSLVLNRALPESVSDKLFLQGVVRLDHTWLANQSGLAAMFSGLSIETGSNGTMIHQEGEMPDGTFAASISSTSLFDKLLISRVGKDLVYGNPFLLPCLILALITSILMIAREFALNHRLKQAGNELVTWAKSISPIGGFTAPGRAPVAATGVPAKDLAIAKELVSKALEMKNEQIHKIGLRRDKLETQVRGLNEDILSSQKRLSELAELDSLAIQLGNTSESFLNHVQDMNLKAEDMSDIAGTEIAERGAILHSMLMEWQEGVTLRGSRKFIRTLAETKGTAKDSSLLDDQIITIATIAGEISDLAINASILAHKIAETSSFSARIAGLWHGIALKTNTDKVCTSLQPVIDDAQEVIKQNKKYRFVHFQNLVPEHLAGAIPEIPVSLWQSALFQVYASAAEISSGKPARIVTRIRQDADKTMLVVQVAATEGHVLPQRTQRQTYLLEVAKSVLTPFAIEVSALPALEGPFPVALTWSSGHRPGQIDIPMLDAPAINKNLE